MARIGKQQQIRLKRGTKKDNRFGQVKNVN